MKYYKGFDKDMKCMGFQYEVGKTYETDKAKLCKKGFHACEAPLDVLNHYAPTDENGNLNKFCEVQLEDVSDERGGDTKVCAKKIIIGKELNFFGLANAHVDWVKKQKDCKKESASCDYSAAINTGDYSLATNTGNCSEATNAGYRSAATNAGCCSAATNTGDCSVATNTGDCSAATNKGYRSAVTNTGEYSVATNTGDCSAATNTGDCSVATNTGNCSAATNTGDYSVATNTGDSSVATNAGNYSVATNTGNYSASTSTGNYSVATNTGNCSAAMNTGDYSVSTNTGENSISIAWGVNSKAKASKGSYIVLSEWTENKNDELVLVGAKMVKVDGEIIKPDVFYKLKNGEFVEAEQ